jgi:hypothetical protein
MNRPCTGNGLLIAGGIVTRKHASNPLPQAPPVSIRS